MAKENALSLKEHWMRCVILAFSLLFIINYFLQAQALKYICFGLLIIILIQGIPLLPKVNFRVVSGLFIFGAIILLWSSADLKDWVDALMQNASLVVLFATTPMMSLPFFYEDYQSELKVVSQTKMQSLLTFCIFLSVCSHFMAVLISLGAIIVIYDILQPHSKLYQAEDIFLSSLVRSHCSSGFWSPAWASMVVVTAGTGIDWVSLIPLGIAFSVVFLVCNTLSVAWEIKRNPGHYPRLQPEPGVKVNWSKIRTMVYLVLSLIGMIIILSLITHWDLMVLISLTAAAFPLLCGLVLQHLPAYRQGMKKYYATSLVKVRSEVTLFAAAGFLGKALQLSGLGNRIPELLPDWLIAFPPLMCGAIMAIMILPSFIGIHPVATGTAIVASLVPAAIGMNTVTFAWTVLTGWVLTIMLSPFSGIALILGSSTGLPSWTVSVGHNWRFGLVCLIIFSLLISLLGPFL
jgi:DcuC family C4-dicarboxylate transporter